jgi:hypothetical protein
MYEKLEKVGKPQNNSAICNNSPSVKKGNIQQILKDAATDGKRRLAVATANKKRAIIHSEDRERLAELFKTEELKPPPKSADAKVQRYYLSALESWVDLKLIEQRGSAPYSLSNVRTRAERYRQRYHDLVDRVKREDIDSQLKKTRARIEYYNQNPEERAIALKYINAILSDPSLPIPDGLKKTFVRIERGNLNDVKRFDRSKSVDAKEEMLI